jgi:hypothetical protein
MNVTITNNSSSVSDISSSSSSLSKRPSTQARVNCAAITSTLNTSGYAVIGDTVSGTLYARRLLNNGITQPITLINEGVDITNRECILEVSFPATNSKRILQYLIPEQVNLMNSADEGAPTYEEDKIFKYYVGSGPLGDFIATYFSPRVGPWFTTFTSNRLIPFINTFTIKVNLNPKEMAVSSFLQNVWGIPSTTSVIVKTPSILGVHYIFMTYDDVSDTYLRQLFVPEYKAVSQTSNVDVITGARNLVFNPTAVNTVYDITGTDTGMGEIDITDARLVWKTNYYTYFRLAANGGLNPKPALLPTFYRARLPIPLASVTGVSTTSTPPCSCSYTGTTGTIGSGFGADLITSYISFSLYDLNNPKQTTIAWLAQAYTTSEDLSVTDPSGAYADTGYNYLIIEAISVKNKRKSSFDTTLQEVQVLYNDPDTENAFLLQFATIATTVYQAYTGKTLTPETLIQDSSVCNANGACQDANVIVDYSLRESPLSVVMQLVSALYGSELYPTPGGCCSSP